MSEQAGYGRMMDGLSRDDQEKMPFGYVSAVTLCRDANGRVTAEWPNGARGCLISRELLDQMIEEANDRTWIDCKKRLPDLVHSAGCERHSGPVLAHMITRYGHSDSVCVASFGSKHGWMVGHDCVNSVSHWMPLPQEPAQTSGGR